MNDIDIHAKTDRELLIILVGKMNTFCDKVDKLDKWVNGNGIPGAKFQVWIMWVVFIAIIVKII